MLIYNPIIVEDNEEQQGKMIKVFAENIKKIRLKKGLTQEQVAEKAGINPKYLGEIERGMKSPTAVIVHKLANALSVPVCTILSTKECPFHNGAVSKEVMTLFVGKREKEVRKAVRILEVFFE